MKHSDLGFTLLEICLVLAVLALLGAIAVPAYRDFVQRAQVNKAIADIGTLSLQLHRWETNVGALPATLAEAGLDGAIDPWGNEYAYLTMSLANRGQVRRDRNLVPINTDFDLYSPGPDGRTNTALTARASRDDVVRANNGAFIGRAEDY